MSVEDLKKYEELKADILRAYELGPEAYNLERQKKSSDSHIDCARYLQEIFERWVANERLVGLSWVKRPYGNIW